MFFDKEADIYAPPGNPRIGNDKEDSFITFLIVVVILLACLTIVNLTPKEKISTKLAYHVGDFVEEDIFALLGHLFPKRKARGGALAVQHPSNALLLVRKELRL